MKSIKRRELRALRASLENKAELSIIIEENFINSDLYKNADELLLYYSVADEVSTDIIFSKALEDGKRIAFPVCIDGHGIMQFFYVEQENDLAEGMYGIRAPKQGCKKFIGSDNAVCVVPGLAFDKSGNRIGYGKGYYDRFLESFTGLSVGLCYDKMLCDFLPTDPFDKNVSYLITDKKIYDFANKEDFKYG